MFIRDEIFLPSSVIHSPEAWIAMAGANPGAKATSGEGGWTEDLCLLYHRILIQSAWQSNLQGDLFPNSCSDSTISLYQSCSIMIQLQSCYSNHSQTTTGSWSNPISKLTQLHCYPLFSHWLTVSLTLDLIISKSYMTPRLNHLSKVVLLQ
jgi:hypothetical protein